MSLIFFFNDTATTEIYALSLHDALPICYLPRHLGHEGGPPPGVVRFYFFVLLFMGSLVGLAMSQDLILLRSEEHTSELQSRQYIVCRLLLEKKKIDALTIRRANVFNPFK